MPNKRTIPRVCEQCGAEFLAFAFSVNQGNAKYCGLSCWSKSVRRAKGAASPKWRGGINHHSKGYLLETCPGHPNADQHGYVLQHRLVMERHLGRYLLPTEDVHHDNDNKADNRIENLILLTKANHTRLHMTGSANPTAKLDEEKVREIRHRRAAGETYQAIADSYGVHWTTVRDVVTRKRWGHVA